MNVTFHIRGPRQALRLLPLIRADYRHDGIPFDAHTIGPPLRKLLRNPARGRVQIIKADGKTASYAMLSFNFDLEFGGMHGMLTDLFVLARYRGTGIGGQALQFIEEFFRQAGIQALELQVQQENRQARAFYRRAGFQRWTRMVMGKDLLISSARRSK